MIKYLMILFSVVLCYSDYTLHVVDEPKYGEVSVYGTSLYYSAPITDIILLDSFSIYAENTLKSDVTYQYVLIMPISKSKLYAIYHLDPYDLFTDPISFYSNDEIFIVILSDHRFLDNSLGSVKIYDAVGNKLTNEIPMRVSKTTNGQWALYTMWDKINLNGRLVASGAYIAIVRAKLIFNDKKEEIINTRKMIKVEK